ncbi:MAG: hypothetical protein IBX72_02510 [Nitrospirae bacterium]|jgi:hypothetical protein|nr:hypothetical protein [Nitrospirota bacterium]
MEESSQNINKNRVLAGIGELFVRSWDIFKRRAVTLIFLYIMSIIFFSLAFGIFFGTGHLFSVIFPGSRKAIIAGGGLIGCIAGFIAMLWGLAAFICAVSDETLEIKNALESGSQRIGSFIWLFIILGFIVTGGFLLIIIPGIIFAVWFIFSQFILAREKEKGMNALLKSKEYVKGYWFDVFIRLSLIWFISVIIGMIPVLGAILSIFFVPYMMIFVYLIYDDLKTVKGEITFLSSRGEKLKWIGAGILGYIILPFFLIGLMGVYLSTYLSSLLFFY